MNNLKTPPNDAELIRKFEQVADKSLKSSIDFYNKFSNQSVDVIDKVSILADRGSGNLLLGIGSFIAISAVVLIMLPSISIQPSEYIALLLLSFTLIIGGALLRLYVFRVINAEKKDIRRFNQIFIEKSLEQRNEIFKQYLNHSQTSMDNILDSNDLIQPNPHRG